MVKVLDTPIVQGSIDLKTRFVFGEASKFNLIASFNQRIRIRRLLINVHAWDMLLIGTINVGYIDCLIGSPTDAFLFSPVGMLGNIEFPTVTANQPIRFELEATGRLPEEYEQWKGVAHPLKVTIDYYAASGKKVRCKYRREERP